jgi:hypothetical protein
MVGRGNLGDVYQPAESGRVYDSISIASCRASAIAFGGNRRGMAPSIAGVRNVSVVYHTSATWSGSTECALWSPSYISIWSQFNDFSFNECRQCILQLTITGLRSQLLEEFHGTIVPLRDRLKYQFFDVKCRFGRRIHNGAHYSQKPLPLSSSRRTSLSSNRSPQERYLTVTVRRDASCVGTRYLAHFSPKKVRHKSPAGACRIRPAFQHAVETFHWNQHSMANTDHADVLESDALVYSAKTDT